MTTTLKVRSQACLAACAAVLLGVETASAQEKLHFTYLWHLEQPIYWPGRQVSGADRYERAWESILRKDGGGTIPQDDLRGIFGLSDRVAVYQYRVKDCVSAISTAPEAGAQISFSGGLIENITSLGNANQLGYSPTWYSHNRTARSWNTSAAGVNAPRLDVVLFSFHHALLPLLDDSAVRKEIQLYKRIYADAWGTGAPMSRGFFPSEMAFETRLIPILASEGVEWTFVSAEKISRACADFPVVMGSGGINCDPPNRADQMNPAAGTYVRSSISRGCSPAEAAPFALTPRRAQYVNPATGAVSSLVVVPCAQGASWRDGYAPLGLSDFNTFEAYNNPARPMLIVLAHDGDNAWGGGFSYYMESTPTLVSQARNAGYVPTVVQKYLNDHPVPANDIVHVEPGAWVNADGDFGAPQFINWNWPLLNASGQIDVENGWHEDARNWAVITAAQNRIDTAEQVHTGAGGTVNTGKVLYPDASTNGVERAWHYFLAGLNSGFMYYGTALDMEVKPTVACNLALQYANPVIASGTDATAPTIWAPQRHPWNPGSTNFGPQYGYQQRALPGDFWVWSFISDVSGVQTATLKYRVDADGSNPLATHQNETYAGGPEVGAWQSLPMTRRVFPAGNIYNNPGLNFYEMPTAIADQYHARVTGLSGVLVDYYIEAVDNLGNTRRSAIQHVYVGDGDGGGGGGPAVTVSPNPPLAGQAATITYNPSGRPLDGASQVRLHYGFNQWTTVIAPDPAMTLSEGLWRITVPVSPSATQLDIVFNNGAATWDNNGGQDWHFAVSGGQPQPQWTMDGVRDADSTLVASNNGVSLWAGYKGGKLYVATQDAGEGADHFILLADTPGPLRAPMWAKAGQVAGWSAFLADENDNDYEGWSDAIGAAQAMTGANGGVLEGTLDLAGEFGQTPDAVYLSVARYPTANGAALLASQQAPASINGNGIIDSGEYVRVEICSLTSAGCCSADFDGDGDTGTDADIEAFFACLGGACCPTCGDADFDNDGDSGTDADIEAFFRVLGGGSC